MGLYTDYNLYAVDAVNGSEIWSFPTGSNVLSSPAVSSDGKVVFVGSNDNNLYTVDAVTGSKIRSFPTFGGVDSSPALSSDGKVVYVGSDDTKLYAIAAPPPPPPSPNRRRRVGVQMLAVIGSIAAIYFVVGAMIQRSREEVGYRMIPNASLWLACCTMLLHPWLHPDSSWVQVCFRKNSQGPWCKLRLRRTLSC